MKRNSTQNERNENIPRHVIYPKSNRTFSGLKAKTVRKSRKL